MPMSSGPGAPGVDVGNAHENRPDAAQDARDDAEPEQNLNDDGRQHLTEGQEVPHGVPLSVEGDVTGPIGSAAGSTVGAAGKEGNRFRRPEDETAARQRQSALAGKPPVPPVV